MQRWRPPCRLDAPAYVPEIEVRGHGAGIGVDRLREGAPRGGGAVAGPVLFGADFIAKEPENLPIVGTPSASIFPATCSRTWSASGHWCWSSDSF